jgi:hypothetical protein
MASQNLAALEEKMGKIASRYNPENDLIPIGPMVTWAENELMLVVLALVDKIRELDIRISYYEDAKDIEP